MSKVLLVANLRPSTYMKRMLKHTGDISVGSKSKIMAERWILGKKVIFYENGLRVVEDEDLSENDEYGSEILRLAHASLLINDAVGDKRSCYVDARVNPVEVVIYNTPAKDYIKREKKAIDSGKIDKDFVLGSTIRQAKEFKNERTVKLFGR